MIWWTITSRVHHKSKLSKKIIHTFLKGEHLERVSTSQLAPISLKGKPPSSHVVVENVWFTWLPHYPL